MIANERVKNIDFPSSNNCKHLTLDRGYCEWEKDDKKCFNHIYECTACGELFETPITRENINAIEEVKK